MFAAPVTQLRLGQPDDGNQPQGKLQRIAYDRQSEAFGAGFNGPFLIAVDIPKDARLQPGRPPEAPAGRSRNTPGMVPGGGPARGPPSQDGEMATIFAIPTTAPQDKADQRTARPPARGHDPAGHRPGTPLAGKNGPYIGGNTPIFDDLSDKVASRLPLFISVVIGLSVLLLIMAFRSLWIPLFSLASTSFRCWPRTASSSRSSRWASAAR